MALSTPLWRLYERVVASIESSKASAENTVIPNAKLVGHISGTERQIDVLIDARNHNSPRSAHGRRSASLEVSINRDPPKLPHPMQAIPLGLAASTDQEAEIDP